MGKIAFCHSSGLVRRMQVVLKEDEVGKEGFKEFGKFLTPAISSVLRVKYLKLKKESCQF
jgi:hypothetical protein